MYFKESAWKSNEKRPTIQQIISAKRRCFSNYRTDLLNNGSNVLRKINTPK